MRRGTAGPAAALVAALVSTAAGPEPAAATGVRGESVAARSAVGAQTAVEVEPGVEWTTIVRDSGPVRINVLAVDPARVRGVLSNERIARRERVSAMSRRVAAVAGVNGGYFTTSGDPVGVLAMDGALLSEPVNGRSALILPATPPGAPARSAQSVLPTAGSASARSARPVPLAAATASARSAKSVPPTAPFIAPVRFRGRIGVNGRFREIDGIDRTRGLIPACGGRGGDRPTTRPNAVLTCGDASELVVLTRRYGARPPREGGVEAVIRDGRVTRVRPPGSGPVPRGSILLTGTGDAARFLRDVALPRSPATITLRLTTGGKTFDLAPGGPVTPPSGGGGGEVPDEEAGPAVIVGGGPRLLRAGRVAVTADAEGFRPPQAPAFFHSFVSSRQPRTLAGVRADGTLLLATVDGRLPGWSVGMTLREAARLMRSLGARDALNLDGGGSSTMVVRGEVVSRPADRVERRVSDGLFVLP